MPLPRPARRVLIPLVMVLEVAVMAVLAAVIVVGVLTAPFDRRMRVARVAAMGLCYLVIELGVLIVAFGLWLGRPFMGRAGNRRWDDANLGLLTWALSRVLGAARRVTGFVVDLEEPPDLLPLDDPEPVLVLARHGGPGDSFALVWLLAHRYRRRPRIVLKQVLRWDPLIDVVLTRMGACFVGPSRSDGANSDGVASLAGTLVPGDALLLFPEGGNWTPRRRLRAIGRLWRDRRSAAASVASLMEHVLPPRTGGVMACLGARPGLPVVMVAHTGLDRITSAGEMWRSLPFPRPMSVRWWRPTPPPAGDEEQEAWLTTEWAVVDQWIDAHH